MKKNIPKIIELEQVFEREFQIQGEISLASLDRFEGILSATDSIVTCTLFFFKKNKDSLLRLTLNADIILECQRCLENYSYPLRHDVTLQIISEERENTVLDNEYVVSYDDKLDIYNTIADEIILCLPISPLHDLGKCPDNLIEKYSDNEVIIKKQNPFTVLKNLKK